MSAIRRVVLGALLGATAGAAPLIGQAPRLYVANQDDATVSIIDLATRAVTETVDLRQYGFGDNARPHHIQVEPDGGAWYVTLIGAGKVVKFDHANRLLGTVAMEVPGLITLDPTQDLMFVGRSMSAVNPPPRLALIRRSDMKLLDEVDLLFPRPHGLAAHPNGKQVYVASLGTNQIASVGADDGEVRLVDVVGPAHGFVQAAVSPDGKWLAVTAQLTDELMIFDLSDPRVPVFSRSLAMPDGPFEPVFTRDGRWIFVTCLTANRVAVVDAGQWQVVDVLSHEGFGQPHGVALSPDGRGVFVGNRHQLGGVHDHEGTKPAARGTVVAICAATRVVEWVDTVGNYAAGMGAPMTSPRSPDAPTATCR